MATVLNMMLGDKHCSTMTVDPVCVEQMAGRRSMHITVVLNRFVINISVLMFFECEKSQTIIPLGNDISYRAR